MPEALSRNSPSVLCSCPGPPVLTVHGSLCEFSLSVAEYMCPKPATCGGSILQTCCNKKALKFCLMLIDTGIASNIGLRAALWDSSGWSPVGWCDPLRTGVAAWMRNKNNPFGQVVVAHAFNPSTREAETDESLSSRPGLWFSEQVPGQSGLYREPVLKKQKQKQSQTKAIIWV